MNQTAVDFIKAHEGCKLTAYSDVAGIATIGVGATGPDIKLGMTWTQKQADDRLASDIQIAETGIKKVLKVTLSDTAMAALDSFVFNIGVRAFSTSHLLQCINSGDYLGAAKAFMSWNYAGGKQIKGLTIRRLEEAALFLKGI